MFKVQKYNWGNLTNKSTMVADFATLEDAKNYLITQKGCTNIQQINYYAWGADDPEDVKCGGYMIYNWPIIKKIKKKFLGYSPA